MADGTMSVVLSSNSALPTPKMVNYTMFQAFCTQIYFLSESINVFNRFYFSIWSAALHLTSAKSRKLVQYLTAHQLESIRTKFAFQLNQLHANSCISLVRNTGRRNCQTHLEPHVSLSASLYSDLMFLQHNYIVCVIIFGKIVKFTPKSN